MHRRRPLRNRVTWRVIWMVALLTVCIAPAVWGHRLIAVHDAFPTRAQALRVEDVSISQVAYVELTEGAPDAWLRIDVDEPTDVFVSLGVPKIDRLIGYRPSIRVLGPEGGAEQLLFTGRAEQEPRLFHEPFTGTGSWIHVEEWISLPSAGAYYLVSSAEPSDADKVWISVGRREVFGIADVLSLPDVIRDVRAFHEVAPPSRISLLDWAALLALLVVGGIVLYAATR